MTIYRRSDDPTFMSARLGDMQPPEYPKMPPQVREQLPAYRDKYMRYDDGERDIVFGQAHKLKCLECDLHFIVLTIQSFWSERTAGFCPECGGSRLIELRVSLLRTPIDRAERREDKT